VIKNFLKRPWFFGRKKMKEEFCRERFFEESLTEENFEEKKII